MKQKINTLAILREFIKGHIRPGDFCLDATAGRGHDTAFLAELVGREGRVLAFDIQQEALSSTKGLLEEKGLLGQVELIHDGHQHLNQYVQGEIVDGIVFNFGYLPGADHDLSTLGETSILAIEQGLNVLKKGGIMSLCIYHGGDSGFEERDLIMGYLATVNYKQYTVLVTEFYNRPNNPPIAVEIIKNT